MRKLSRILAAAVLATSVAALKVPTTPISRRGIFAAAVSSAAAPLTASAAGPGEGGALAATCLGFGCNSYGGTDFNGLPADVAPPGSMPYPEFLQAIKDKKVEGVVFQPPAGDVAYAIIGGKSVRIGEGWPVEISNSWSSPTWVVRILQNEEVPYAWNFDLTVGTASARSGRKMTKAEERYQAALAAKEAGSSMAAAPYRPAPGSPISALSTTNAKTGQAFTPQPKMYGGAETATDTTSYDWAKNGLGAPPPK